MIATSPLYVEAMAREVSKRFEGFSRVEDGLGSTAEEERAAEDGAGPWR